MSVARPSLWARLFLAGALFAAATLKASGWLQGEIGTIHAVAAVAECGLAVFLVVNASWLPLGLMVIFLLASLTIGLHRAWTAVGLEGSCRCLGPLLPLRVWQQLVLTALLLFITGGALLVRRRRA